MRRNDVIDRLQETAEDLKGLGVRSLFLFGSTARDEARPESDVDVFVEYDRDRFGLIELVGVQHRVSEVLGRPVDVTTRDGLHPSFREKIEAEAVKVF